MHPVTVNKAYAEIVLECIDTGKPIPPMDGEWTIGNMLAVAGVLVFGVSSHGPILAQPDLDDEQQTTSDDLFVNELLACVGFLATVSAMVEDGYYDENFEPVMKAAVSFNREQPDRLIVRPVEGWKHPGDMGRIEGI